MKKYFKKFLSIILAAAILLTISIPAFAAKDVTPVIVVSGMGAYPLYDDQGKSAWPIEQDKMVADIASLLPSAAGALISGQWNIFEEYGFKYVYDMFEPLACDENGKSIHNITPQTFPESADHYHSTFDSVDGSEGGIIKKIGNEIGWDNTYFLFYDWRKNPMDIADELDVTVNKALKEHNTDKVTFIALSFGGMIVSSYVYKYGTEHIKNVVHGTTAFLGVDLVGKALTGQLELKTEKIYKCLKAMGQNNRIASVFGLSPEKITEKYGKKAADIINIYLASAVDALKDPLYKEIIADTFAHFPGIWCLMPASFYEEAKTYMSTKAEFGPHFFDDIDDYLYNVQSKTEENFNEAIADGVNIYVIGAYGYMNIPVVCGECMQADNLIETEYESGGCTVASFGEELKPDNYERPVKCTDKNHHHISTDNIIDASTAILPEHTWIIKNMTHVEFNIHHQTSDLMVWLATSDEYLDVYSDSRYPQFIELNRQTGKFRSLTDGIKIPGEDESAEVSFIQRLIAYFKKIVDFFSNLFIS